MSALTHEIEWRFEDYPPTGRRLFCFVNQHVEGGDAVVNRRFAVYCFVPTGEEYLSIHGLNLSCTQHSFLASVRGVAPQSFVDDCGLKIAIRTWLHQRVFFVGGASEQDRSLLYVLDESPPELDAT
jgi:hypothetical protein